MDEHTLFSAALECDTPAARDAYLAQACGSDVELRERVESLLRAHAMRHGILDGEVAIPSLLDSMPELSGTILDRYKLIRQIGEGGMGVVYLAEQQEPVQAEVALKIIKPGMDTRDVIARFDIERRAWR